MNDIHRNVLLYWSGDEVPDSVRGVADVWSDRCPGWSVTLMTRTMAITFLENHFGPTITRMFRSCAVPAMQSDFVRVFWALSKGGIYSDVTFVPSQEPLFFDPAKALTVARWGHGRIVNGLFYAQPNCRELQLVAFRLMTALSLQKEKNIWIATGPGAWIAALGQTETQSYGIVPKQILFRDFIEHSDYESSTRGTDRHWSVAQKQIDIYQSVD